MFAGLPPGVRCSNQREKQIRGGNEIRRGEDEPGEKRHLGLAGKSQLADRTEFIDGYDGLIGT